MLDSFQQCRVLEEAAVFNRLADTGIVLQDALARTDILMAHFRVPHLAFWQAHRWA